MKIIAFGKNVCLSKRLFVKCPGCEAMIVLDRETFEANNAKIFCYKCDTDLLVMQKKTKKTNFELDIMYKEKK